MIILSYIFIAVVLFFLTVFAFGPYALGMMDKRKNAINNGYSEDANTKRSEYEKR
ncbi:hypothetical protein AGMMS50268_37170 [Spirochaetia bacterium]|nr:hypothetical protein AGMMS50268_37170 [Spirochaetia bacterium]